MKITTAELITVSTGKLCCTIDRVYEILDFLTGESLYTHQLPRAARTAAPILLEKFPWLTTCGHEAVHDKRTVDNCVAANIRAHGNEHEIEPLETGIYEPCGPISELERMTSKPVIVVQAP